MVCPAARRGAQPDESGARSGSLASMRRRSGKKKMVGGPGLKSETWATHSAPAGCSFVFYRAERAFYSVPLGASVAGFFRLRLTLRAGDATFYTATGGAEHS